MMNCEIISKTTHCSHETRWSTDIGLKDGHRMTLCVTCFIDTLRNSDVPSVRKNAALSRISWILKCCPGALRELLRQDHTVSQHFTASVLRMLYTLENPATLGKVIQVLVQLLVELQSDQNTTYVLDEIYTQLNVHDTLRSFLPIFKFLGRLVETLPHLTQTLVVQYEPMLKSFCRAMLYPGDELKASVLYLWLRVFETAAVLPDLSIPITIKDQVCTQLLQTLVTAVTPQLILNCIGLLRQLLQMECTASFLMNNQIISNTGRSLCNGNNSGTQSIEHQSSHQCSLPLMLKKLLLSGDEMLQVASAQCVESVLIHMPNRYCSPFILADIPEFLFECLANSRHEVLLWSVYRCLLLLTQDQLFFSQCHSVYGMESLVHSVKETMQLVNLEVQKQGILLLTVILERQPPDVHLFPTGPAYVAVSEAVVLGVCSPCLTVAAQASRAASALLRLNHQPSPVQYKEIEVLLEAVANRCSQLPQPLSTHHHSANNVKKQLNSSRVCRSKEFLHQALLCFQAACRLAESYASEPIQQQNAFTSLYKHGPAKDSVESLCTCLLHCCDSVFIPSVISICECDASAEVLQCLYCILSSQFTLFPTLMPTFATKLAHAGFFRLALRHKALFCAGNRNPNLNLSCCNFLQRLTMCLLSHSNPASHLHKYEDTYVEDLLQCGLPSLCYCVSDWPSVLCENPEFYLCDNSGTRATQYSVVIILHLALQSGDRLLPDQTVFTSVIWLLCAVQELSNGPPPLPVLRSALYLLSVTQDKCQNLEWAPLSCISKLLSSCQSFSSIYIHHLPLLHFIYRYPELVEKFGSVVLELWLTQNIQHTDQGQSTEKEGEPEYHAQEQQYQKADSDTMELLTMIKKYPSIVLSLLSMVHTSIGCLAQRALGVLQVFLHAQGCYEADLCAQLKPALLQTLQRLKMEHTHDCQQGLSAEVDPLPLVLRLLCVLQANDPGLSCDDNNMDGLHFKLLYNVGNIAGKLKPTKTKSLLSAFNYLYCCLSQSPAHCTDRAVSAMLSNCRLLDQLQTVLSSSWSSMPFLCTSSYVSSALLCCCHLLLSSLISLQHVHSTQVHKNISWSLDRAVHCLLYQKRSTDSLLLVSILRLLKSLLDIDLVSPVLCVTTSPTLVGPKPLELTNGALYPLGSHGTHHLFMALCGLLLKKHELLLRASVSCLASLLNFLHRKSPNTAQQMVCQPWSRFLQRSLINSGESCLLHPATLTLITSLQWQKGASVLRDSELLQLMEAVESRGVTELSQETSQALKVLFTKIQGGALQPPLTEDHFCRMSRILESLNTCQSTESNSHSSPSPILCVGDVSICLSDFEVGTEEFPGIQTL